jgi:transposase
LQEESFTLNMTYSVSVRSSHLDMRSVANDIGRMDASALPGRKRRIFRPVEQKRRIVKLTLEPGASVASVALANGVNTNQVFRWKRQYEKGELQSHRTPSVAALVPVTIATESEQLEKPQASESATAEPWAGTITIEFPGRALLGIEGRVDTALVRAVLEAMAR